MIDFLPDTIDINTAESDEKPVRFYGKTKQAVDLILNHGVDEKTAILLAGCKTLDNRGNLSQFRKKLNKYALSRPGMQKLASNAVQDVLKGKVVEVEAVKILGNGEKVPYVEKIVPTYTNKLAAAAMVFDRTEPIIRQNMNLNINTDVAPVDLDKYRNR